MQVPRMPDLEPNPKYVPPVEKKLKKKVVRKRKKRTTPAPKRELPCSSVSQPRDHLGRFASKAWGVTKAIGGGIGKCVAHVGKSAVTSGKSAIQKKVKKGIKSAQQRQRKKKDLKLRERHIKIRKQEIALGLASPAPTPKKKVIRRRKKR